MEHDRLPGRTEEGWRTGCASLRAVAIRLRRAARVLVAASLLACAPVQAANHALILWIGDYVDPRASLPGIDKDAEMARRMAQTLGVPAANITELSNEQLSLDRFRAALRAFTQKIEPGDNAFIYYSGHGFQNRGPNGGCVEGIVAWDLRELAEPEITDWLVSIGQRASRVVFMNDSCFSGGHVDASRFRGETGDRPKVWKTSTRAVPPGYRCGDAVNAKMMRAVARAKQRGANVTYLAASSNLEISMATPMGSAGTLAWNQCTRPAAASGADNAFEPTRLTRCAQDLLRRMGKEQTITLVGESRLSIAFTPQFGPVPEAPVQLAAVFQQIRALASPAVPVQLDVRPRQLDVDSDLLKARVTTSTIGYLHLLYVGPDGRQVALLFPNAADRDNLLPPGSYVFPREGWRIRAQGPAGTGYLMAVVTTRPRELLDALPRLEAGSPFRTVANTAGASAQFVIETTGNDRAAPGRFGASEIVPITLR